MKRFAIIGLLAALCVSAVALAGCAKWSPADLSTAPATVRLDGVTADAVAIDEALAITELAAEDALAGTQVTFNRGDAVEWVTDPEGNPLTTDEGMAVIRITQGQDKEAVSFAALVDARFLRLDADPAFAEYTAYALTDARWFGDFSCENDEQILAVNDEVRVVDEIDGVLVAQTAEGLRFLTAEGLTDARADITPRVNAAPINAGTLARGDEVAIVGEDADYYLIAYAGDAEGSAYTAFVPKWLVRTADEAAPGGRTGYSAYGAVMYGNAMMTGSAVATLSVDTVMEVIDEFGGVAFVKAPDGTTGYLYANQVTDTKNYRAPRAGGGGGGSSSGGGAQDGGDISLSSAFVAPSILRASWIAGVAQDGKAIAVAAVDGAKKGTVLSDATPVFWGFLDRGDLIHQAVTKADTIADDALAVQLAGRTGWMDATLMRLPSDAAFTPADLYTQANTQLFANWERTEVAATCARNDVIHVVDEYGTDMGYYVIEVTGENGTTYRYVAKGDTSQTEIPAPVRRTGGGGGGSSSGGGSPEWTAPVL